MKRIITVAAILLFATSSLFAAGSSSSSNSCATKYPIVLSHGMGAQYEIAWGIAHYWNDIPDELRGNGATVYITSVTSMDGTVEKATQWKRQLLDIIAVSGAQKVNVIGHSHGSVYSRYAMTNLGVGSLVASHTSISGPHRGSSIASLLVKVIQGNILEDIFNGFFKFLMGDTSTDTVKNLKDLTPEYMKNVFNPNTPNKAGVYYQSYAYQILTVIGAGMFLPTWPILSKYEGPNDGLVSLTSAKWGTFRGVVKGAWWAGVNHLSVVDMMWGITPGFDAPAHFVSVVSDLKNKGY